MTLEWRQRPIDEWPGELTARRKRSDFKAGWGTTLALLERELGMLRASNVVCQVALREKDFRIRDGAPKANARADHPGVILAFESKHGPLRYACDTYYDFSDNVRAIALGLEALRKVDRYGIAKDGQQYRGYSALGSGTAMGAPMSKQEAWRVLVDLGTGLGYPETPGTADDVAELYRMASKLHHPDHGGDADLFRRATEARDALVA